MKIEKENAIQAFKAFESDWKCKGFQYEVGKIYHHDGKIELCNSGFHACEKLADCFNYYDYDSENTRVAKVKVWGTVLKESDNNKLCAEYIEIVEELNWEEVQNLCNTGDCNTGDCNTGNWNTGDCNTGDCNTGDCNTGNWNTGNWNTGDCNTGDCNTGNWNTGDCNTGNWNTGNWNTGDCNTGNWNTGDCNTGDCNTGDCNTGNWNTGYFNTEEQDQFFCFNKLTKKQDIDFPAFLYFELVEWVYVACMTDAEKNDHPECDTIGGYLKEKDYKEAFRESFENAKKDDGWQDQLKKLKAIPNFDDKIFEEISGIHPEELV
ncbi:MAG: hypothetical protein IJW05_12185 [Lentisphaeria bacterium]|nr:hypothetical protein [Lentisphaeria bacterium]